MRRIDCRLKMAATILAAAGLCLSSPALASSETPETPDGETLFNTRTCFTCHGKDGKTPILPDYPLIAGQNAPYVLQQLKDIKSGARTNGNTPAMRGVMHLVSDEEMVILADYISKLER
jgi:cytochrome c